MPIRMSPPVGSAAVVAAFGGVLVFVVAVGWIVAHDDSVAILKSKRRAAELAGLVAGFMYSLC